MNVGDRVHVAGGKCSRGNVLRIRTDTATPEAFVYWGVSDAVEFAGWHKTSELVVDAERAVDDDGEDRR